MYLNRVSKTVKGGRVAKLCRDLSPAMVAATTFWGLLVRRHLARISDTPAASITDGSF